MPERYDLLVVGGGINGAGIARDAAGRGLKVLLVEQNDLAGHTSSASTKLVHGGLRYLEHYEFRLVREALGEREVLLRAAPHIIWPMRFVLPQGDAARPAWMVRAGLFLYDHLGKRRKLPGSRAIDLTRHPTGAVLKPGLRKAFVYSDCWAEDARLVVLNAMDAAARGARILTRTRCVNVVRQQEYWQAELESVPAGQQHSVRARMLVNATGPWVRDFLDNVARIPHQHNVRMVAGSHIVVPAMFEHDHAYLFQNADRRIVFAIPFEGRFTLIGTTDRDYVDEPQAVRATAAEIDYLCAAVNRYFAKSISRDDVVWQYAGVRPLYDDGTDNATETTREYVLDYDDADGAPLLAVFGGKITTYRRLAEHAMQHIQHGIDTHKGAWTATAPLPGGDMPNADFEAFLADFKRARPWLPEPLALHYARTYGTCATTVCGTARQLDDLGENLGAGLHQAELDYLVNAEWAQTADDVLWRRTKWGLHLDAAQRERVAGALGPASVAMAPRAQGL